MLGIGDLNIIDYSDNHHTDHHYFSRDWYCIALKISFATVWLLEAEMVINGQFHFPEKNAANAPRFI